MQTAYLGETTRDYRLQYSQLTLRVRRLEELFLDDVGGSTPEIIERGVALRELIRSRPEEQLSGSRPKHGAYGARRDRYVSYIERRAGTPDDGRPEVTSA